MVDNSRLGGAIHPPANERVVFAIPAITQVHSSKTHLGDWRRRWLPILLWVIFSAGLLVEMFGPSLTIKNKTFIIPQSLFSAGDNIHPAEIVANERRKQVLSAILTLGGALALACYYRAALLSSVRSLSPTQRGTDSPLKSHSRMQNRKQQDRKQQRKIIK